MKQLYPGNQSQARLDLLISLSSIRSDTVKSALSDYLVTGHSLEAAAAMNSMKPNNLFKAVEETLEPIAQTIVKIEELDWERFRHG